MTIVSCRTQWARHRLAFACALLGVCGCGARSFLYSWLDDVSDGSTDASLEDAGDEPLGDAGDELLGDAGDSAMDAGPSGCTFTCQGCCLPDGGCSASSELTCGWKGDVCEVCLWPWMCKGRVCFRELKNCGPENCTGCCGGNNCFSGAHASTCGHGGASCVTCLPEDGHVCTPLPDAGEAGAGGVCKGLVLCSPVTCKGCCAGDICATGTQDVACGTGGQACMSCVLNFPYCIGGKCRE